MPAPATTGKLCTTIQEMEIGDYISCSYMVDSKLFRNIGATVFQEIPYTGGNPGTAYSFYFIKVDKGLMIADRIVVASISWDNLNSAKYIQGQPLSSAIQQGQGKDMIGIIRSLTGGVAYADANGNSVQNSPFPAIGYFPLNNEWDRYIMGFPSNKIQVGKTLDDVFHWSNAYTWTQDTWYTNSSNRVLRGLNYNGKGGAQYTFSTYATNTGFRPVFEYKE